MRKIAIKGDAERGNEIIELLEMMGGKNSEHYTGRNSSLYYFIDERSKCISTEDVEKMESGERGVYILFSLSAFKDDYPWVVGDVVDVIGREERRGLKIIKMQWGDAYNTMMYCLDCGVDGCGWWRAEDLKYNDIGIKLDNINYNIEFDLEKVEYEIINGKLIIKEKEKKIEYPKTYKGCCDVLGVPPYYNLRYHTYEYGFQEYATMPELCSLQDKLNTLGKLIICQSAYWKVAGEEMGLGKPWKPDWKNTEKVKYGITFYDDTVTKVYLRNENKILVFPIEEIRDAFYENFKDLIEQCKELL